MPSLTLPAPPPPTFQAYLLPKASLPAGQLLGHLVSDLHDNLNGMAFSSLSSIALLSIATEALLLACPEVLLLNANKMALVLLTTAIKTQQVH